MNLLDIHVSLHKTLKNRSHIPYWIFSPFRKISRELSNLIIPRWLETHPRKEPEKKTNVIVSFTTFPARINYIWIVVECMLRQTYQPMKIILWLSKKQFDSYDALPDSLRKLTSNLFEIRFVDEDYRSHKKYYYVSKEYPDSLIFFVDDDLFYDTRIIERTLKAREKYPDSIICNYGSLIQYDGFGNPLPYNMWKRNYDESNSSDLFFGSGGGTLIKPTELYRDLTNIELARTLTPIADDIWLNAMVRLANKPIHMLKNGQVLSIEIKADVRLASQNKGMNMNDKQIEAVRNYYPNNKLFAK